MICKTCGVQLEEGATVCSACGTPVASAQPQTYGTAPVKPATPGLGLAIAGMVCGILSFFCFPYILGALGIIFGGIAKSKGCNSGMATAGIVCGVIGIALWVVMLIACSGAGIAADMLDSLM